MSSHARWEYLTAIYARYRLLWQEGYQDDEVDDEVPPAHLWHNRGRTSKPLPLRKNMFGV